MNDRCYKCQSEFRGQALCPRCGADMTSVLESTQMQQHARNQAFAALAHGDFHAAHQAAERSQTSRLDPSGDTIFGEYMRSQYE